MRQKRNLLKLPATLVDELGGQDIIVGGRKERHNQNSRKDVRKAERLHKRALRNGPPPQKRLKTQHAEPSSTEYSDTRRTKPLHRRVLSPDAADEPSKPKSILKRAKEADPVPEDKRSSASIPSIPSAVKHRLDEDDEEIAALEKKLGIKGKKSLPQSFRDDGLDKLLGLGEEADSEIQQKRLSKAESDWLDRKRREARGRALVKEESDVEEISDLDEKDSLRETGDTSEDDDHDGASDMSLDGEEFPDGGSKESFNEIQDDQEDPDGFEALGSYNNDRNSESRMRENPYVAPTAAGGEAAPAKYVPPSLRKPASTDTETLLRLRRQMQGLVNRLTEANLLSILSDIEKLYRDNARQHVTSTLVDLLLTQVCEPTSLPDTSIIVPAGFISAVYKVIGTDFGAQVIQKLVGLFREHYAHATTITNTPGATASNSSKETSNLMTLLSELYNFQVVGSNLIFDYVRLFLDRLSELNAELLLKIIRTSGPQLRQDDPSALKEIVAMLHPVVSSVGEENISVRTRFMIETINNLKNNRMKTGTVASAVTSEHTIRMKKTLGTLNNRTLKGSEPLRIGLKDIEDSDKKGKWWLVGASWSGASLEDSIAQRDLHEIRVDSKSTVPDVDPGTSDLIQLAGEQRMNTDIRRAIFITIMSASDYQDAYLRLVKLKLKRVQELEIPKVLIRCSGAEKSYNPYYTLIAQKLCGDRRLKMAFQFSLWDFFKKIEETDEGTDFNEDGDEDLLDTRRIVNMAKMFGSLIAEGGLGLGVLKNLNLSYLQPKTKIFLEVLFISILLRSQRQSEKGRDEQAVINIFTKVQDTPRLLTGLQYFLKKVIRKTDIAGGKVEKATVRWACRIAVDTLEAIVGIGVAKD